MKDMNMRTGIRPADSDRVELQCIFFHLDRDDFINILNGFIEDENINKEQIKAGCDYFNFICSVDSELYHSKKVKNEYILLVDNYVTLHNFESRLPVLNKLGFDTDFRGPVGVDETIIYTRNFDNFDKANKAVKQIGYNAVLESVGLDSTITATIAFTIK